MVIQTPNLWKKSLKCLVVKFKNIILKLVNIYIYEFTVELRRGGGGIVLRGIIQGELSEVLYRGELFRGELS